MRRALVKLALFAALLLALDRLVFAGAVALRDAGATRHLTQAAALYDPNWDPEIVFFGDSRTLHNYDLRAVERATGMRAYNFGDDGSSPEQQLFTLEEYLRVGHHPRVVVFQADPASLDEHTGIFDHRMFREHQADGAQAADLFWGTDLSLGQRVSRFAARHLLRTALLANRLPDILAEWLRSRTAAAAAGSGIDAPYPCGSEKNPQQCRNYGGAILFLPKAGTKLEPAPLSYGIAPAREALYEHLAALAESQGFAAILAETPRYRGDAQYEPKSKKASEGFYCGLAERHDALLFARLSHVGGIDQNDSLYMDWTHLNSEGAARMAKAIAPLIAAMAKNRRPQPCVLE
jgi:hypothetical protein